MRKRPKFRIGHHVRFSPIGKLLLKAASRGSQPTEGEFLVLGNEDRTARSEGHHYLLENIKNPDHFALWVPEEWLEKVKEAPHA